MTAKEFLLQAWQIDKRVDARIEELERLEARLTAGRISSLTGMPRGGHGDWTDAVANLVRLKRDLSGEIIRMCAIKRQVYAAIDAVEPVKYRTVLELRYRNHLKWEKIADVMGYDVRTIYEIHGKALLCVRVPDPPPA